MPCPITLERIMWGLREAEPRAPGCHAHAVEIIGTEIRDALGGTRLTPHQLDEAAAIVRLGLAALGASRDEAERQAAVFCQILIS